MSYKYINPGYYTLFDGWSAGSSILPQNKQKTGDYTKNPLNGVGFDCINVYYKIPKTSTAIFFSMGVFVPVAYPYVNGFSVELEENLKIDFEFSARATVRLEKEDDQGNFKYNYSFFHKLEYERYNRILFKIDTIEGTLDIWINGEQLYSQVDNSVIMGYGDLKDEIIALTTGAVQPCFFSNFIASDEEIKPNEDVLVLPKGAVESEVAPNEDGSYTFTQAGQYYLMNTDVTPLKDNDIVTGIAAIAYPGYSLGDGLYAVEAISKNESGIITAHTKDNVPSDILAASGAAYSVNMSKVDLAKEKIGLRVIERGE